MMVLTPIQTLITIVVIMLGTMCTRFLPFIIFRSDKATPPFIDRLGKMLPYAVIGLLVVYCLKGVSFTSGSHGIPEFAAVLAVVILHLWKKNSLLSIGAGTVLYMVLVQGVFG